MKRALHYMVGIAILGFITVMITKWVIQFLPIVAFGLVILTPIYGMLAIRFKWKGINKFVPKMKEVFSLRKKTWTFYILLGIVVGFAFEAIVEKILLTLAVMLAGFLGFCALWETVRFFLNKFGGKTIPSFVEACKNAW